MAAKAADAGFDEAAMARALRPRSRAAAENDRCLLAIIDRLLATRRIPGGGDCRAGAPTTLTGAASPGPLPKPPRGVKSNKKSLNASSKPRAARSSDSSLPNKISPRGRTPAKKSGRVKQPPGSTKAGAAAEVDVENELFQVDDEDDDCFDWWNFSGEESDPQGERSSDRLSPELSAESPDAAAAATPQPTRAAYRAFVRRRQQLAADCFATMNRRVFDNLLPQDLPVLWSSRLLTTAGQTKMKKFRSTGPVKNFSVENAPPIAATILLSEKIITDEQRLQRTLLHEMCHAAQFLVDAEMRPPHGPAFRKWAHRATLLCPELPPVSVTHSYELHFPLWYRCTSCDKEFGRHSRIPEERLRRLTHARCGGALAFVGRRDRAGRPVEPRTPTPFNLFVKSEYAAARAELPPGSSQREILTELSARWKARRRDVGAPGRAAEDAALPAKIGVT